MFLGLLPVYVVSQPACTGLIRVSLLPHVLGLRVLDLAVHLEVVLLWGKLLGELFDHWFLNLLLLIINYKVRETTRF